MAPHFRDLLHLLGAASGSDGQQLVPETDAKDGLEDLCAGKEHLPEVGHHLLAHLRVAWAVAQEETVVIGLEM